MALITVDTTDLRAKLLALLLNKGDVERITRGLAAAARQRWVAKAQKELRSTSRDYIAGIGEIEVKGQIATIALTGKVPNMVEQGWSGADMRATLLGPGAKNVKTAADGSRYNTVPFRHGTPGTGGRNVGREMPPEIHKEAKKLVATVSRIGANGKPGAVMYGGRLVPTAKMGEAARTILATKERAHHWGSIYLGMIKEQKTYEKATQNQFTTFRRISTNVKRGAKHWVHPGITARAFAEKVQQEIKGLANDIVSQYAGAKKR